MLITLTSGQTIKVKHILQANDFITIIETIAGKVLKIDNIKIKTFK
jgi:hypothetical protein